MTKKRTAKKQLARRVPAPPPQAVDELEDDDELELTEASTAEADAMDELEALLVELGSSGNATVTVKKMEADGEKYCSKYLPAELEPEKLRDRFGSGNYWLYVHKDGRLYTKRQLKFARTLDELNPRPAAPAKDETLSSVIHQLQSMQDRQFQLMMEAIKSMRPAGQPDMMQMIDAAAKLANLGGRKDDGLGVLMEAVNFVRSLKDEASARDEGGGLASIAREALEIIRPALQPAALPAPQAAPAAQPQTQEQMAMFIQRAIQAYLPTMLKGAQAGSDPAVYAQLILDQVPEQFVPLLVQQLQQEGWFDLLVRLDGRVVAHREWLESVVREVIQATSQDPPPAA